MAGRAEVQPLGFAEPNRSVLSRRERYLYYLYYGPLRRAFRWVLRPWLRSSTRVRFGPARGTQLPWFEPAYQLGIYELHVQHALKNWLKSGDVFFDVGANRGFYTLLGSRWVGIEGKVFGFEPLAFNCEQASALLLANPCGNVELITKAVGNKVGWIGFRSEGSAAQAALASSGTEQVPITTLDDFVQESAPPDAVLVDVEGAELLVLEGARKLLTSQPPRFWLIEVHSQELLDSIAKYLAECHYRLQLIPPPVERKGGYPRHLLATFSGSAQ